MNTGILISVAALAAAAVPSSASAAELLVNGDFSAGLSGWTSYTTVNGGIGAPQTVAFDIDGDGSTENAARLNVGEIVYTGAQAGGGIGQIVNLATAGMVTFAVDFAAHAPEFNNASGGLFSVLFDGFALATFDTGSIAQGGIERGSLSFSGTFAAGAHLLQLQATRPWEANATTPFQYFANASLQAANAPVPEPGAWALLIVGFGVVGAAARRRRAAFA